MFEATPTEATVRLPLFADAGRLPYLNSVRKHYLIGSPESRSLDVAAQDPAMTAIFKAHAACVQELLIQYADDPNPVVTSILYMHAGALHALCASVALKVRHCATVSERTVRALHALYEAATGEEYTGPAPAIVIASEEVRVSQGEQVYLIALGHDQAERPATVTAVTAEHIHVKEEGGHEQELHRRGPLAGRGVSSTDYLRSGFL